MIDIRFDHVRIESDESPLRDQLSYLRAYLNRMADDLNQIIDTINASESFTTKQIGVRKPGSQEEIKQVSEASRPVDMGGKKITNLGMPSEAGDAASMEYVLTIFNQQKGAQ